MPLPTKIKTKKWTFSKLWKLRCQYGNPIIPIMNIATIQECLWPPLSPAEALCWPCKRERCLFLAVYFAIGWLWVFPPQGRFQGCNMPALWLEAAKYPYQMQLHTAFTNNHAMVCPMSDFPIIWHKELRDMTASLLSEVCHNIATQPRFQPLNGESMTHHTAITTDDARFDICARGFWSAA